MWSQIPTTKSAFLLNKVIILSKSLLVLKGAVQGTDTNKSGKSF